MGPTEFEAREAREDRRHDIFVGMVQTAKRNGLNTTEIANQVLRQFCPKTATTAPTEGVLSDLRNGIIKRVKETEKHQPHKDQISIADRWPQLMPLVEQLSSHAFYVPSRHEQIDLGVMMADPPLLLEAYQFMGQKRHETSETEKVLGKLYQKLTGIRPQPYDAKTMGNMMREPEVEMDTDAAE